jgi:hypothetical protein
MTKSHGNREPRKAAAEEGLIVYSGDPTAVGSPDPPPELEDVETALLMTDDDGFNGMLSADLGQYYGHDRVYQLAASGGQRQRFLRAIPDPVRRVRDPRRAGGAS